MTSLTRCYTRIAFLRMLHTRNSFETRSASTECPFWRINTEEKKQENRRGVRRDTTRIFSVKADNIQFWRFPGSTRSSLFVNTSWTQGRGLASEAVKLFRREMLKRVAGSRSWVSGLNFVLREQLYDQGLIWPEWLRVGEILKLILGQLHEKHEIQRKIWLPVHNLP